jgi:uncharacterized protein YqiB (DUF1249 family)
MRVTPKADNLEQLLGECERNYQRLAQLAPGLAYGAAPALVRSVRGATGTVSLHVLERGPYTTLVELSEAGPGSWLPGPQMRIRVSHDARVAEVVSYQGETRFGPRYPHPYPNRGMIRRDEKLQLNRLLGEWLRLCLARGYRFQHEELVTD